MRKLIFLATILFSFPLFLFGQDVIVEGYVYETGNRGYLGQAIVTVLDKDTKAIKGEVFSDEKGVFQMGLPAGTDYVVRVEKKPFETMEKVVSTKGKSDGDKVYVKYEMKRMPGYNFEVTLAPSRSSEDVVVDAITGARIEVYNNTTKKEELVIENSTSHVFNARFEQGNHYTILIRKDEFFNKRLEAYVNVKGCILCFDGVGDVKPGVADVLTEGLEMGTLLANVELEPIKLNKAIKIENIYYDLNSARIKSAAKVELDKLVQVLKDNSSLLVEIGSHTDSRGNDKYNQKLSAKRAKSVVDYLKANGINTNSLISKGYGENKLVNRCKNGVDCSERRHQQNRRTELKVVGFVNQNLIDNRSLAQLKEEEHFADMLKGLEGSEIKVEEGQDVPNEIKKQLKDTNKKIEIKEPVKKQKTQKPSKKQTQKPKMDKPVLAVPDIEKPVKKETVIVHKPMPEKPKVNKVNTAQPPVQEVEIEEAVEFVDSEIEEDEPEVFEPLAQEASMQKNLEVSKDRQLRKPKKLRRDYSGYRVEFITSMSELPTSHAIFSRHGNIVVEENKTGGYAYLLGDFDQQKDAEDFLNNILIKRYPGARVIQYERGRRVVN